MINEEKVMTVSEVADYLRLSPNTIRRYFNTGELPGRKIGGQWRILRSTLIEYLDKKEEEHQEQAIPLDGVPLLPSFTADPGQHG